MSTTPPGSLIESRLARLERALQTIAETNPTTYNIRSFARAALEPEIKPTQEHRVEMGDDGMIHCRTCGRSWWPHDPGRTLPNDICAADPVVVSKERPPPGSFSVAGAQYVLVLEEHIATLEAELAQAHTNIDQLLAEGKRGQ